MEPGGRGGVGSKSELGEEAQLARSVMETLSAEQQRVLDHTLSGGVTINEAMFHAAMHDAPFGGVGDSGMGAYHGREGFMEFCHSRTIYRSGWWDPRQALGLIPPYGPQVYERLKKTLRV